MKLREALEIIHASAPEQAPVLRIFLACGFQPLHLGTFLRAHLRGEFPTHAVELETGLYGDLPGNLARMGQASAEAGVVVIEWPDLDPRLGIRESSGWSPRLLPDILQTCRERAQALGAAIEQAASHHPIALCLPTLPIPPVHLTGSWQAGSFETGLRHLLAEMALRFCTVRRVRLANVFDLASRERRDVKAELLSGFPYTLPHASEVAAKLARLVRNPLPAKGLITDLDNTLWAGILGEDGLDGVHWSLERGSQVHAIYQQLLAMLAGSGILLAIASKNDSALAAQALTRPDLLVQAGQFFPVEANWGRKSEAVGRILQAWNIGADSVLFIDDSAWELDEVRQAYPKIECLQFPANDPVAAFQLVEKLRDRFARTHVSEEDLLRRESLRAAATAANGQVPANLPPRELWQRSEAQIEFHWQSGDTDPRALELINKTNQFNLNGERYTEAGWEALLAGEGAFLVVVSYKDKFGPLGKIAVLQGRLTGRSARLHNWVMSCRAFSRAIEHRSLAELFQKFDLSEVTFDFRPTERNGPLREFLDSLPSAEPLTRGAFYSKFDL